MVLMPCRRPEQAIERRRNGGRRACTGRAEAASGELSLGHFGRPRPGNRQTGNVGTVRATYSIVPPLDSTPSGSSERRSIFEGAIRTTTNVLTSIHTAMNPSELRMVRGCVLLT